MQHDVSHEEHEVSRHEGHERHEVSRYEEHEVRAAGQEDHNEAWPSKSTETEPA